MDASFGSSGLVDLILSWTSPVIGIVWYLYNCTRCATPWSLITLVALTTISALYHLGSRLFAHGRSKPRQVILPFLLLCITSAVAYRPFVTRDCHGGQRCDPGSAATLLTPSGLEVPLISSPRKRPEDWVPTIDDPDAVDPQEACHHHRISNVKEHEYGLTADLDLGGRECNVYGNDVPELTLIVEYQAKDRLHIEILPRHLGPQNESWFILPEKLIPKPKVDGEYDGRERDLDFVLNEGADFGFSVRRNATGEILFATEDSKLVFEDQFFELRTSMPVDYNLYGLGEVMRDFRLENNLTRTLYNADIGDPLNENLYGSHPIYLDTRYYVQDSATGKLVYVPAAADRGENYTSYTHGVFMRNAHGLEVLLRDQHLTWRGLGGAIDLYFYAGPSAKDVMRSYQTSTVGLPAMQQYWSLGFHQCRWGYTGWKDLQYVIDQFEKANIPLETIWADIDYMYKYRDFTNDPERWSYEDGEEFIHRVHKNGQHFVPIVDAAIYAPNLHDPDDKYATFERGVAAEAFIKNPDGSLYIGQVWPGFTVFPDWVGASLNDSETFEWWTEELTLWYDKIKFDGIWVDMSEAASFCEGSCGSDHRDYERPLGFLHSTEETQRRMGEEQAKSLHSRSPHYRNVNRPPYVINNVLGYLTTKAVAPEAVHRGGIVEYDVHNLFGHQMLNATYNALLSIESTKRPFIIGRSTFAGSGKWAGHWGGDNYSLWPWLALSIPQALSFSIFGIPYFGVDACGFALDANAEICARWMELAAFFPFYRNHNEIGFVPQEPYVWPEVAEATRRAMKIRYSLLPYFYTLMYGAHQRGDTVLRALVWEFPEKPWLAAIDRQFLVGPALLVTAVVTEGARTVEGVFPGSGNGTIWYDWYTHRPIDARRGENVTLDAALEHIPLHIRGGHVLVLQEPGMTTRECRDGDWEVLVALSADGVASGEVYIDDGESLESEDTLFVSLEAKQGSLSVNVEGTYEDTHPLRRVTIMGVKDVSLVAFNGKERTDEWRYDREVGELTVDMASLSPEGAWVSNWKLEWK